MSGTAVQNIETDSAAAVFRGVTFRYPGDKLTLIENLDFTVRQGEFVSLIGPSGCGKSTIFRLLNRLNEPVAGEVETFARVRDEASRSGDLKESPMRGSKEGSKGGLKGDPGRDSKGGSKGGPEGSFRRKGERNFQRKAGETSHRKGEGTFQKKAGGAGGIGNARCGYMPQQDMLFPWRTVAENVRLPLELRGGMQEAEMNERVAEALKDVGLEGWGDKLPRELSGGMRQRASFARTLMTGADLLLLDEPFSALDYLTRLTMREWLLEQWEKDKKTVLFITHDVEEAVFLSNRILAVEHSPIRELREYRVPLSYPRTESALAAPEALALKEQLIRLFREAGK